LSEPSTDVHKWK